MVGTNICTEGTYAFEGNGCS